MKLKPILTGTLLVALAVAPLALTSCNSGQKASQAIQDSGIAWQSALSLATTEALKRTSEANRTAVANYIDYAATQVRTIKGVPSTEQFVNLALQYVPSDVKSKYPELVTLVTQQVSKYYQLGLTKYGSDAAKVYDVISQIAFALEAGAAPYARH